MTIDMTNNRVPYGLLTDEEKAALHEHEKAGGAFFELTHYGEFTIYWQRRDKTTQLHRRTDCIYRTIPLPKTQDLIAWEKLPDWVEWVARDADGEIRCSNVEPVVSDLHNMWEFHLSKHIRRIDKFPGIVWIGTVDWRDSKQRRPR